MKHLGAAINLEKGTCFLKQLSKPMPVVESKTGLLHARISDGAIILNKSERFNPQRMHFLSQATRAKRCKQARAFPKHRATRIMPTRREVTQMLHTTAESIMNSKALLTILMNQVATQVSDREVPPQVNAQRGRVEELADLMKQNVANAPNPVDEVLEPQAKRIRTQSPQ